MVISIGTSERKLGIPGEEKYYGKGVSYCAICDGTLYKNKTMVVIGDSDYAIEEALYLSKYAKQIFIINNKEKLDANKQLLEELGNNNIIEVKNNCNILSINGDVSVTSVTVEEKDIGKKDIETSVVFPFIGNSPDSLLARRLGIVDDNGYIQVNGKMETKIKGIYAAGDCTNQPLKQIATAVSGGAIAAIESYKYISTIKKGKL